MARKRPSGSDEQLEQEISSLKQQRVQFTAEHAGVLAESAHHGVDLMVEAARERFERAVSQLRHGMADGQLSIALLNSLVLSYVPSTKQFADELHRALDEAPVIPGQPAFSSLSVKQYESEVNRFGDEIRAREHELALRVAERAKAEADKALAEVEGRGAATSEGKETVTSSAA
jgi:hypothetical protein